MFLTFFIFGQLSVKLNLALERLKQIVYYIKSKNNSIIYRIIFENQQKNIFKLHLFLASEYFLSKTQVFKIEIKHLTKLYQK